MPHSARSLASGSDVPGLQLATSTVESLRVTIKHEPLTPN